jgi:alpha-galactosidase
MMLNPISGLCLDAENGSAGAGARVELYGCNGGGNQGWVPTQVPGGIHVVGVGSGLCLAACGV